MGKRRSDARKAQHQADDSVGYRHEVIGPEGCRYLERWLLGVGLGNSAWFTLRLHHFFRSDEDHLHDHPFWFLTLVLWGSYEDWVDCPTCHGSGRTPAGYYKCPACRNTGQILGTRMTPGTLRYRPALHRHRVVTDGCWTLVLSGPRIRDWGFWVDGKWLRQRAYFRRYGGSAACE